MSPKEDTRVECVDTTTESRHPDGRCAACGSSLGGAATFYRNLRFCGSPCIKLRVHRQRKGDIHQDYPALPFSMYSSQRLFHPIDLSFPGLQLVSAEPYIFIVRDFLNEVECKALRDKAAHSGMGQQVGAARRTQ